MRICVFGAGVAGLVALRRIQSIPGFEGVVYEQTADIGGVWSDLENQKQCFQTPMYQGLRINTPREGTCYLDFEFTHGKSSYVYREDVHVYLKDYVEHYKLGDSIQFRKKVVNVKPNSNSRQPSWEVKVQDLTTGAKEICEFDAVMVCSGHFYKPLIPEIPGIENFKGEVFHSQDFESAAGFENKRVVVMGAGPSAGEIAVMMGKVASKVVRSFWKIMEEEIPALDNIEHLPRIKQVKPDGSVLFEDGQEFQADCLVYGTGYEYDFPFLDDSCAVKVVDGKLVSSLYKHCISTKHPTLCIIGVPMFALPFSLSDIQARYFLSCLSGKISLPNEEEMAQEQQNELKKREDMGWVLMRHAHKMENLQWDYFQDLAQAAGFEHELKPVLKGIFDSVLMRMMTARAVYREDNYRIIDDHTFEFEPAPNK